MSEIIGYSTIPTAIEGVSFIPKIKVNDLIDGTLVHRHTLQRDEKKRLHKRLKDFRKKLPSLYHFSIANVKKHISGTYEGELIDVQPGVYMVDGHTRVLDMKQSLKKGEKNYPDEVMASVYDITDWETFKELYYSFDNPNATEKNNEKIVAACDALGIFLTSTTGRSGGFGTALNIAYPGNPTDEVLSKVAYFKDEIITLDEIGLFNPKSGLLKSQCLMAAALEALKYYNQPDTTRARIIGGLTEIAKATNKTLDFGDDYWYGIDMIKYEFLVAPGTWIGAELHRKTSYAALDKQMDFFWYCIERYMNKKKVSKDGGVKTPSFKDKHIKYQDLILAANPIVGYDFSFNDIEDLDEEDEE